MLKLSLMVLVVAVLGCRSACPPAARSAGATLLRGVPGPEDFELQTAGPGAPRLLVASQEDAAHEDPRVDGRLIAISLAREDGEGKVLGALELTGRGDCSFRPHGISLTSTPNGEPRLYVINHHSPRDLAGDCLRERNVARDGRKVHSVEVYEPGENQGWRMRERLLDPLLTSPNDLAALPDGTIYLSNTPTNKKAGFPYEALIGHSSSSLVMYDGRRWHRAAFRSRIPNGMAVDPARHRLYVAETGRKRITIFALDGRGGATSPDQVGAIPVGSGVDNLSWGPEGPEGRKLWIAAHPSLLAWARLGLAWQRNKPRKPLSPSEVYRIDLSADGSGKATRVFCDDGALISAASVAFPFDGSLFVGQCFSDFVLRAPYHP